MTTWILRQRHVTRSFLVLFGGLLLMASGLPLAPSAHAADDDDSADYAAQEDAGDSSQSARIRFLDGDVKIERYDDDRVDEGSLNAPVFPGDVVTTAHGRGEVQLPSGTLVRLDENSKVTFLSVPGYDDGDDDTVLQISEGSANVEVHGALSRKKDFRVDTPSASVYLLAAGRYRIDVEGRYKKTRTSAFRGVAEVVGDDGSVILRSGQRTFVGDTSEPESPRTFNTSASDEFDGWVLDRTDRYRRASEDDDVGEDALPEQVRPYQSELSYYGEWVDVAPYGRCWSPGGVAAGWRPYSNGFWSYGPSGNFWVSNDPWGWAPYHYGRWFWAGRGWFWVPGGAFSGAWVSWYYGPNYFGWCPLDYWDNPMVLRSGYTGIDFHCWNFVNYHNIFHRNPRRVFANPGAVRVELNRGVVTRRAVAIRPRDIRENRLAPPLVLQKARELKSAQIDINAERLAKRSFRDREKEVARISPTRRLGSSGARGRQEAGRPSTGSRPRQDRRPESARDQESRGRGRDKSKGDSTESSRPRQHGEERQDRGRDDGNRGHGGKNPSNRSMSSNDLLPSRPRVASGLDDRPSADRGRNEHPGWDRPRSNPSDRGRPRTLGDDGANSLRPEVPRRLRGPGGTSEDDPRNGWGPTEFFREADGQRGRSAQRPPDADRPRQSAGPRPSESRQQSAPRGQGHPSSGPRAGENRSAPRPSRQAPPPQPPPQRHNEEKKKR